MDNTLSANWFRGYCSSEMFITGDLRYYLQRVHASCHTSEPMKGQWGRKGCFDCVFLGFFEAPDYERSHDKTGLVSALLHSLVDTTAWSQKKCNMLFHFQMQCFRLFSDLLYTVSSRIIGVVHKNEQIDSILVFFFPLFIADVAKVHWV